MIEGCYEKEHSVSGVVNVSVENSTKKIGEVYIWYIQYKFFTDCYAEEKKISCCNSRISLIY